MELFDDFKELEADSIRRLEEDLRVSRGPGVRRRGVIVETLKGAKDIAYVVYDGVGRLMHNMMKGQISLRRSNVNNRQRPTAPTQTSSINMSVQCGPHILLCIDNGSLMTTLFQERLGLIDTDQHLFVFLKSKYYEYKPIKSWLTLRSLKQVSLTRVR